MHHIIPREFGGKNDTDNLVLLCSNCHSLTHYYSSKRFQNKELKICLKNQLENEMIDRLTELTRKIQEARSKIIENDMSWTENKLYSIDEAIEQITRKNKMGTVERDYLSKVVNEVLKRIPDPILKQCSFRLLKNGKYLSINLHNHLLFRTPAYGDFAEKPKFDCYLTFPKDRVPLKLKPVEKRDVFFFAHFDCINVGLSYVEVLQLEADWKLFEDACRMAQSARKTRDWLSNIKIFESFHI
ncbi:MAG: HNH endonuclease [Candidatus Bathyarchaeota archaeon]|nr:HNH endonuclease [Candidatus Termiticorpusculum sp.]